MRHDAHDAERCALDDATDDEDSKVGAGHGAHDGADDAAPDGDGDRSLHAELVDQTRGGKRHDEAHDVEGRDDQAEGCFVDLEVHADDGRERNRLRHVGAGHEANEHGEDDNNPTVAAVYAL